MLGHQNPVMIHTWRNFKHFIECVVSKAGYLNLRPAICARTRERNVAHGLTHIFHFYHRATLDGIRLIKPHLKRELITVAGAAAVAETKPNSGCYHQF